MASARMPEAEVDIDADLVRRLLSSQFPEWSGLPIEPVRAIGFDNAIYRLGDDLVARLPRRQFAADLVDKEHRWLAELAPRLPLPIPVPIGTGVPDEGYPWRWSVCPWLPGEMAAVAPIADMEDFASTLGRFIAALHTAGPDDGPRTTWRGAPLAVRDEMTRTLIQRLRDAVDAAAATAAWEAAVAVPAWSSPQVWVHGDLHPANVLVDAGRARAVIDFGDLGVGDPATDLLSAWMLLPPAARPTFRHAAAVDEDTWARGRGWVLTVGLACLAHSADNPVIGAIGRRGVDAVLAEMS